MPMYNLIEHSDNYSKTLDLWQYYRDEPGDNITHSKLKSKFINKVDNTGTPNAKITVSLKHLKNFRRTLELLLIISEISLIFPWSVNCVIYEANREITFAITDTELYVQVAGLSIQDKTKDNTKDNTSWNSNAEFKSKVSIKSNNTRTKLVFKCLT